MNSFKRMNKQFYLFLEAANKKRSEKWAPLKYV